MNGVMMVPYLFLTGWGAVGHHQGRPGVKTCREAPSSCEKTLIMCGYRCGYVNVAGVSVCHMFMLEHAA